MQIALTDITTLTVFQYFLVFCRIGSALMVMPGIGEIFVLARARLAIAVMMTLAITPVLAPELTEVPGNALSLLMLVLSEVLVGVFLGGIARMIQATLHVAGSIMAFLSGLAAAQLFDATQGSQGSVFGNFLTIIGIVLFFVMDLHHLFLRGMADSYAVFEAGHFPPMEDFALLSATKLNDVFEVAFRIAAPQLIVGLALYLCAGLMARLAPSIQVFFLMVPVQISVSFYVLLLVLPITMMWYIHHFEDSLQSMFYP